MVNKIKATEREGMGKVLSADEIDKARINIGMPGSHNVGYLSFNPLGAVALFGDTYLDSGMRHSCHSGSCGRYLKLGEMEELIQQRDYYVKLSGSISGDKEIPNIMKFEYDKDYNLIAEAEGICATHLPLIRQIYRDHGLIVSGSKTEKDYEKRIKEIDRWARGDFS